MMRLAPRSAQSEVTAVNADEFTRTILTLKRAALQFGAYERRPRT